MRADDRGAEVGAGRGDDAGGERRRVEAVVDRGDEVLLDRGRVLGLGLVALHHVEVVRRVAEVGVRRDRLEALAQPPQRADQRGHDRAGRHRVVAQLGVVDVDATAGSRAPRRTATPRCAARRAARTSRRRGRSRGARRRPRRGRRGAARMSAANASRSASVAGKRALEHQVPDVFERPRLGEVDRAVLAVVVEAFEAAHVADGRVGDDHAFEPFGISCACASAGWIIATRMRSRIETMPTSFCRPVDDRDVAVAVLGERRERGARLDVGADRVGVGRHPLRDLRGRRVGAGGREAEHVAFGEDADRAVVVIDHDDGSDLALAHALRGGGDRLGRLRGDDRRAHEVGDGSCFSHGSPAWAYRGMRFALGP